jgi:integrase
MRLWEAVSAAHELDVTQVVTLTEACRAKDRLDQLDELLRGDVDTWATLVHRTRTEDYELKIDRALSLANSTADNLKKLLAALRLPDPLTGKRPQRRGPRGVQKPAKVSSLEQARARHEKKGLADG